MRQNSGNSPKNKKTAGFQDAEKSPGTDMRLHDVRGQINTVGRNNSVEHSIGVASYGPLSTADNCSTKCFYEKLSKLHEPSGLSFIFNFQEAKLDLSLLYKAVTERDGFHQVSKHGKWEEIASIFNMKNQLSMSPCQFQKVYENLLFRYEQTHFYRMPVKASNKKEYSPEDENGLDCSALHRKYSENSSKDCTEKNHSTAEYFQESTSVQRIVSEELWFEPPSESIFQGFGSEVEKSEVHISFVDKKAVIDNTRPPPKPRTGYQLFLRLECDRLKKIHEKNPTATGTLNFRDMALQKWKNLSETDRQPYIEASEKEREIYKREMGIDEQPKQCKRRKYHKQNDGNRQMSMKADDEMKKHELSGVVVVNDDNQHKNKPSEDDEYHVTLEVDDVGNSNVSESDQSLVESTIQVLKNARPTDPIFQTEWDC